MLSECKKALRITVDDFDSELVLLMMAGADDLKIAGVILPGEVDFGIDVETGEVTDNCSLDDALVMRAIFTYVRANFESPADYDRLANSYSLQREQLMHATGYTDYGEEDPSPEAQDDTEAGDGE
jgi:hypothetical protein